MSPLELSGKIRIYYVDPESGKKIYLVFPDQDKINTRADLLEAMNANHEISVEEGCEKFIAKKSFKTDVSKFNAEPDCKSFASGLILASLLATVILFCHLHVIAICCFFYILWLNHDQIKKDFAKATTFNSSK